MSFNLCVMVDAVTVAYGDLLQDCGAVMLQTIQCLHQCSAATETGVVSMFCCVERDS